LQVIYILTYLNLLLDTHGTVVQSASINIIFWCKQARQESRTHHLGFIRAVSWIGRTCISLLYSRTLQFSCISKEVWVTAAIWCLVQVA